MARYIDAEKLLEDVGDNSSPIYKAFRIVINSQPTADVEEVRHSKLVHISSELFYPRCSECGKYIKEKSNYCPNCGAKMDKGREEK